MGSREEAMQAIKQMNKLRAILLGKYPFFGYIAMHLILGTGEVGTACTDGKRVIFDPAFLRRIDTEEALFVLCHEIMHVCLHHVKRRKRREDSFLWNLACDTVVNSNILFSMGIDSLSIDGCPVITHGPSMENGKDYTAEEMYELFLQQKKELVADNNSFYSLNNLQIVDNHDYWSEEMSSTLEIDRLNDWIEKAITKAEKTQQGLFVPPAIQKMAFEMKGKKQVSWKKVCREFIRKLDQDTSDYGYRPPDRREIDKEVLYPGLNQVDMESLKNVCFFVDKSGSMGKSQIMTVVNEIYFALKEKALKGLMTFFDVEVTTPMIPICQLKDITDSYVPLPGGGTCFECIFDYIRSIKKEEIAGIVIMTDGYATFPEPAAACGIPVLWIMVESDIKAPWGRCIQIREIT